MKVFFHYNPHKQIFVKKRHKKAFFRGLESISCEGPNNYRFKYKINILGIKWLFFTLHLIKSPFSKKW